MRIAQIKNQVVKSQDYFSELWNIYKQLRVGYYFNFDALTTSDAEKDLFIVITSEGSFSGDIDQRLIEWVTTQYNSERHEIIVIGHHGATLLSQRGIPIKKYYKLPSKDNNINVAPIISELSNYRSATVYYQSYVSLVVQDVKKIELKNVVSNLSQEVGESSEIISENNYIFEPDTISVVEHLESSMMGIALGQVILESKLAQYASRFKAMSAATTRAKESLTDETLLYNRARRAVKDERLKEIVNGLKKSHGRSG